jgi:hypothetical protein
MMGTPAVNRNAMAPSTDGCLAILELLSQHPAGLTLSDICRELGLTKNMAFRILNDMAARHYVLGSPEEKRYLLGAKLLQLGVPRVGERNLVDEAAPEIRALRDECNESTGLLVPHGGEAVLVYFQPEPAAGMQPWLYTLLVAGVLFGIQQVQGNVILPRIHGRTLALHPVLILLGVLMGASFAGVLGAILAPPLLATMKLFSVYIWRKMLDIPPFESEESGLLDADAPGRV